MTDPVDINRVPKLNLGLQETDEVFITRQGSGPYRVPASSFPWEQKGDKGDPGGSWAPVLALVTDGVRLVHRVVDWVGGTGEKPTALGYVGATGFVATAAAAVDVRGAQGAAGWAPVLAVVEDGVRRVHQVVDWTGGAGTKPTTLGYVGATGIVETAAAAVDVRGPQGVAGWAPVLAVVADGERRVQQVVDWTGGAGTKPTTLGYVGAAGIVETAAAAVDVRGAPGAAGWAPVLAVVADGERRVQQVVDWTGGAGTKPATLGYVGAAGIVETAAAAVDVRGAPGAAGWAPVLAVVEDGVRRVQRVVDWTGGAGTKPTTLGYVGAAGIVATAAEAVDVRGPLGAVSAESMLEALTLAPTPVAKEISGFVSGDVEVSLAALMAHDARPSYLTQIRSAIAAGAAKVVFAGDSVTEGGDAVGVGAGDALGNYREIFAEMLAEAFPSVSWTFRHFGLNGRNGGKFVDPTYVGQSGTENTETGFLRTAALHPNWGEGTGSVVGKSWLDHVKDSAPDLLVVAFGLNPEFDVKIRDHLAAIRTAANSWPKVPSVALITPMRPYTGWQDQYRAQAIARVYRAWARQFGISIIDVNRANNILRDGFDEQMSAWRVVGDVLDSRWRPEWVTDSGTVAATDDFTRTFGANSFVRIPMGHGLIPRGHDVSIQVEIGAPMNATTGNMRIYCRAESPYTDPLLCPAWLAAQVSSASARLYEAGTGAGAIGGGTEVGTAYTGSSSTGTIVRLDCIGPRMNLHINGVLRNTALQYSNMRGGDILIGAFGGSGAGGLVLKNPRICAREPGLNTPLLSQTELYGAHDGTASRKMPFGGNGLNHPTSIGVTAMYKPGIQGLVRALIE